jgi:signal recognition particle subunit SRP54
MSMAKGGGMPGMPGMPGMGGGKRAKGRQPAKKGKTKRGSGNPAKRAAQERAAAQKPAGNGAAANPFGIPAGQEDEPDTSFELPADLSKYLK